MTNKDFTRRRFLHSIGFGAASVLLTKTGLAVAFDNPDYNPTPCADYTPGQALSAECLEVMSAFPEPVVEQVPLDRFTLTAFSFWRIGPETTNLYNAPGGVVTGQHPAGFNFVRAIDVSVEGWIQIEGGQWIPRSEAEFTEPSFFSGAILPDGLDYPIAWVVDLTGIYASEYPGGPPSATTGLIPLRYDRVNIFAEAEGDDGWKWYMVGPHQWVNQRFLSVAKKIDPPPSVSGRWVAVDLFEQTLVAYEDDLPVMATLIASGLPGTETNDGLFNTWARLERDGMSGATGAPRAYALQSVPWVQYFDNDISLHGTYWHNLFGYPQSRGCVNMTISDANFIYQWMNETPLNTEGIITNQVYVYNSAAA